MFKNNVKNERQTESCSPKLFFNKLMSFIKVNPALSRLLKVTPAVYPHLNDFTGKLNFRCLKRLTEIKIPKPS